MPLFVKGFIIEFFHFPTEFACLFLISLLIVHAEKKISRTTYSKLTRAFLNSEIFQT